MDSARHVIKRIVDPHFLIYTTSHDVASTIHQCSPRHQTHFEPLLLIELYVIL